MNLFSKMAPEQMDPTIDAKLWNASMDGVLAKLCTGIYVRAKRPDGGWESVDLVFLDKASLLMWLRSRGGDNPLAEDVVGILLGHGHLHELDETGGGSQ